MAGGSEPFVPGEGSDTSQELELEDAQGTETEDEFDDGYQDAGEEADDDGENGERNRGSGDAATQAQTQRDDVRRSHSRRPGRREREQARIDSLERENRDFRDTLAQLLAQRNQLTQQQIAEERERERMAFETMSPYEQHLYSQQRNQQTTQQMLNSALAQVHDRSDRSDYDQLLRDNNAYRQFDARVEELKRQAPGVPRRILLATAIGEKALENGGRLARPRGQRNGAERQRERPAQARSDVAPQRTRGGGEGAPRDFEHLRNLQI